MDRNILRLAIPNIISNITVPLLGMVDMAVVGHLDSEDYIGAIAVATTIFNFIYWNFSFLRMGTSGFTAQAYGARDKQEQANSLLRSLVIALSAGLLIIILQSLILRLGFFFFDAGDTVKTHAAEYFRIYIYAAPAILGLYTFNGWFIGMQDAKTPMYIAIGINIVNIGLCLFFVYVLKLKIEGVALASLCAQYLGLLTAFIIWVNKYKETKKHIRFGELKDIPAFKIFFKVNSDILIRTLALVAVTTFFVSVSTREGDDILAVNALLMQLFILFSYFMDGFAYSAEALTGKYVGGKQNDQLKVLVKRLFKWGGIIVVLFSLVYFFLFDQILSILTDKKNIIALAHDFRYWVVLIPICSFSAFLWDGIFVGATASRQMRNSMLIAVAIYFCLYIIAIFYDFFSNNILWLMFIIYLLFRGLAQSFMASTILKNSR
jgi:MATE family multidrug resistance protein